MTDEKVLDLNDNEFEEKVLKSSKPVIIDFWAPWCGPCRVVSPVLEDLSEEYSDTITFYKVNIDENNKYATVYGIKGIPTVIFIKSGKVVDQIVGVADKGQYEDVIKRIIT